MMTSTKNQPSESVNKTKHFDKNKYLHGNISKDRSLTRTFISIVIPATFIAFMSSLYVFIDQLLLTRLLPLSNTFENMVGQVEYQNFLNYVSQLNATGIGVNLTQYSTALIVRNVITYSTPLTIIIASFCTFISNGTSLYFAKEKGKKIDNHSGNAWCTGFYTVIFVYIGFAAIFASSLNGILYLQHGDPYGQLIKGEELIHQACNKTGLPFDTVFLCLKNVYNKATDLTILYSKQYGYILIGGFILMLYNSFLADLLVAEGFSINIIVATIVTNILNIILDWILIYYAHMAVIGSAVATLIGYTISDIWFFAYIKVLNNCNITNVHYQDLNLKNCKFKLDALKQICIFGLPSFAKNGCNTLMNFLLIFIFSSMLIKVIGIGGTTADEYTNFYGVVSSINQLFWAFVSGMMHGARILVAYFYGLGNIKQLRESYALSRFYCSSLAVLFILVIVLNNAFLMIFGINNNYIATLLLVFAMIRNIIYVFCAGPHILFHGTGKIVHGTMAAMMPNCICFIPITFIMFGIAIATGQEMVYLSSPLAAMVVSGIIWSIWSSIYYNKYLSLSSCNSKIIWMKEKGYLKPQAK